ncbi:MAG TPA: metallopeptidase TldD-related protein [Acidimicrobiales bacterium]
MSGSELVDICDRVLDLVGDRAEAAVSAQHDRSGLTRFANSFIHQNVAEESGKVALRVAVDGRVASASTTRTDDGALEHLVARTLEAARLVPPDPDYAGLAPPAAAAASPAWHDETVDATPDDRAAIVRAFVEAGPGLDGAGFCTTTAIDGAFANTAGQRLQGRFSFAALDGIHRTATADGSGHATSARVSEVDGGAAGAAAAANATSQDDAVDVEPGHYEVVLRPGCVANMLVFLGALGFNAKSVADGTSFVHLGEQQFDERISWWDDASDPRAIGYTYDLEGTPKQRVDLVTAGVTTGIVHDRRTGRKAGVASTGHATGDASIGAVPRNVFMAGGDTSADDLVAQVERGLLVTEFHYTRILDPKTQVVTGLTRNGLFLVEDGRVARPVRNLRFTQSFVAGLGPGKVLAVGNDVSARLGFGDTVTHVPSVRLASWNFTGGARG